MALLLASCDKRSWHYERFVLQSVVYSDGRELVNDAAGAMSISSQYRALQFLPSKFPRESGVQQDKRVGPFTVRFEIEDREDVDKQVIVHRLVVRSENGHQYPLLNSDLFPLAIPNERHCVNPPDIGAHKGRESFCYREHRYDFEPLFDFDFSGGELLNIELDVEVREPDGVVREQVRLIYKPILDADAEWYFNPPSV